MLQQICAVDFFPGFGKVSTLDYELHFSLHHAVTKDYVPEVCIHSEIAKHSRNQPLLLLDRLATTILLLKRPASTTARSRETSHSIEDP